MLQAKRLREERAAKVTQRKLQLMRIEESERRDAQRRQRVADERAQAEGAARERAEAAVAAIEAQQADRAREETTAAERLRQEAAVPAAATAARAEEKIRQEVAAAAEKAKRLDLLRRGVGKAAQAKELLETAEQERAQAVAVGLSTSRCKISCANYCLGRVGGKCGGATTARCSP